MLQLSKQEEIVLPILRDVKDSIDLSNQETVTDQDSGTTIKTTFSEIEKEDKTLTLESEGKSKVEQIQSKAKKHLNNWRKGKAKMDIYFQSQQVQAARRKKRAITNNPSEIPRLTKEERASFLEMLKLFEELKSEQEKLTPRLQKIEGVEVKPSTAFTKNPTSISIEWKLREIDWTTKDDVKYSLERPRSYGRKGRSAAETKWDIWENNPYQLFLDDKNDYDTVIRNVKQAEQARDSYLSKNRLAGVFSILGGADSVRATYSGKAAFDKKIEAAKSDIAFKVAAKLLLWMNQNPLKKKT